MTNPYPPAWQALVDSTDPGPAVREHLSFLTASPACAELLDALMANFVQATIEDGTLELVFRYAEYPDDLCTITCSAPYHGDTNGAPASVGDVVRVHNGIGWESLGGGGGFGFWGFDEGVFQGGGGWESDALIEAEDRNRAFLDECSAAGLGPDDVVCPSEYGQNWLIWHPARRNSLGEPELYFVSHGDCVARHVKAAQDLAYGPLLLRIMAQDILGMSVLDEVYN